MEKAEGPTSSLKPRPQQLGANLQNSSIQTTQRNTADANSSLAHRRTQRISEPSTRRADSPKRVGGTARHEATKRRKICSSKCGTQKASRDSGKKAGRKTNVLPEEPLKQGALLFCFFLPFFSSVSTVGRQRSRRPRRHRQQGGTRSAIIVGIAQSRGKSPREAISGKKRGKVVVSGLSVVSRRFAYRPEGIAWCISITQEIQQQPAVVLSRATIDSGRAVEVILFPENQSDLLVCELPMVTVTTSGGQNPERSSGEAITTPGGGFRKLAATQAATAIDVRLLREPPGCVSRSPEAHCLVASVMFGPRMTAGQQEIDAQKNSGSASHPPSATKCSFARKSEIMN
ncbi:uncharacterized protein LOC129759098 [Uranotaenia lowii]|uniref:uncharacterized protein LOC129759098 n=1 Tax=Uranotaenia lowii TaxID=190385 RepID=UPI002478E1D4|nr:uncharacterized protein LOC129759098 [Uranotaenia lowii]